MTTKEISRALFGDDAGNDIQHYGISGQRWGVRRFQNEDGSLTPAGRLRYLGKKKSYLDKDNNWNSEEKIPEELFDLLARREAQRSVNITKREGSKMNPSEFLNEETFSNAMFERGIDTSKYSKSEIKKMQQTMYREYRNAADKAGVLAKTATEYQQGEKNAKNYYENVEKQRTNSQTVSNGQKKVNEILNRPRSRVRNINSTIDDAKKIVKRKMNITK